ncbi:3688_t:CDS:1, partial [Dentiscutata heterogama]
DDRCPIWSVFTRVITVRDVPLLSTGRVENFLRRIFLLNLKRELWLSSGMLKEIV